MEDKNTFISFTIIVSVLNILLLYILLSGLNSYLSNISNFQTNQKLSNELNQLTNEFKIKTNIKLENLDVLRSRYNQSTSISGYLEQLVFKTNEKNTQLYKSSVLSTDENQFTMEVILYGSFESNARVIKSIEEELPLTEITESSVEISGNYIKSRLILKVLIDKND